MADPAVMAWVYVLSGRAIAEIGDAKHDVGASDFPGFVAGSVPHSLHNPNAEDLVYLVGGNRPPFDICDYPASASAAIASTGRTFTSMKRCWRRPGKRQAKDSAGEVAR